MSPRDAVHVIPLNDLREHAENPYCWCKPERCLDEERIIVHNAADGREKFETGERKPS
jgi:hypothetical protein